MALRFIIAIIIIALLAGAAFYLFSKRSGNFITQTKNATTMPLKIPMSGRAHHPAFIVIFSELMGLYARQ